MNYKTIKKFLEKFKSLFLGKYPHKYKVYDLTLPINNLLKNFLRDNNFFDFFFSNKGHLISEHQIVAFFCCGGRNALDNGFVSDNNLSTSREQTFVSSDGKTFASYEVHHINSNSFDNSPENLVFLPTQVHQIVTRGQRRIFKYLRVFGKKLPSDFLESIRPFNRKGKPIKRIYHWITSILSFSILFTSYFRSVTISLKGLYKFAKNVLLNFNYKLDPSFTSSFFLDLDIDNAGYFDLCTEQVPGSNQVATR